MSNKFHINQIRIGETRCRKLLRYVKGTFWLILSLFIIILLKFAIFGIPVIKYIKTEIVKQEVIKYKGTELDYFVDKYALKYSSGIDEYSKLKSTLHCLLYYESKHANNGGKGDNGKASGVLQYHEPTYVNFRKIMIKDGLVDHLGDRNDPEDAVETTAWALSNTRGDNWGPILRGQCN